MAKKGKVLLYGFIGDDGWWSGQDNTDVRLQRELEALQKDEEIEDINLHINSPGGYVHDGLAIFNIIRNSEKPVHVIIDGIAYSMAAIIALAGETVTIASNGLFMLHNVSGLAWGNARDLRKEAETMDKYDTALAVSISEKTGMTVDQVKESFLDFEDHFFTASEALEAKLVDVVSIKQADIPEEATDTTNYNLTKLAATYGQHLHNKGKQSPGFLNKMMDKLTSIEKGVGAFFHGKEGSNPNPSNQDPDQVINSDPNIPMKINAKLTALVAFFGLSAMAQNQEVVNHDPSEDQLQDLNDRLANVDSLEQKVNDLETQVSNLTQEKDDLQAKLDAAPAGSPSGPQGNGDDPEGSNQEEEFLTDADREARELVNTIKLK